ncbi:MAG: branched-chain amino acid ABC transporter substrate-binding protein, partial [Mesorhizobium sp.]
MHHAVTIAVAALAALFICPAGAEVLIGVAGPMTGKLEWTGTQLK